MTAARGALAARLALALGAATVVLPAAAQLPGFAAPPDETIVQPQPQQPSQAAPDAAREILVMLHLPAPHFRGDGYHGGSYRDDAARAARRRIAEELATEHGLSLLEDWAMPALNVDCYRMQLPPGQERGPVLDALSHDPRVQWAQPVQSYTAQAASDPLYAVQPAAVSWQLDELRKVGTGRKVLVAVVDSGIEADHPDLQGQVAMRENFVDGQRYVAEMHGTAVAGVIAARAGNGVGIEGIAPDARLMALRACWQGSEGATRCNSFTLGKALNYALQHGAQVINMSLSGPEDRLLQQLIDVAQARGVRVVGAVDASRPNGGFPASHPAVFAVMAEGGQPPPGRILAAPGRDVPTTMTGARWGMVSGTSYAAAHVSGMMAVLSELKPNMPLAQLRDSVVANSASIDLCATVARITGKCTCACTTGAARYVRSP